MRPKARPHDGVRPNVVHIWSRYVRIIGLTKPHTPPCGDGIWATKSDLAPKTSQEVVLTLISQIFLVKSFRRSQFLQKFVNLFFELVLIENKLTNWCRD